MNLRLMGITAFFSIFLTGCATVRFPTPRIQHIVVIMQENRSVDNLFNGFPGADTVRSGMSDGQSLELKPVPFEEGHDLDHTHPGWWTDWDHGKMDGFNHPYVALDTGKVPNALAYAYVPAEETVPYWTLARSYTFGDRMFSSNSGPSFVAHQYMIAGQSGNSAENPTASPWGCDSKASNRVALLGPNGTDLPGGVYPCFNYQTIADLLDAQGITWRYYAPKTHADGGIWSAFDAIEHIRLGPDWTKNVISPETRVLTDIQKGQLAQVTWIVPQGRDSDHPSIGATAQGPEWVATIVNEIGASKFWGSTAIFISWDDWGGWYDHVDPPQVDSMGLGFRVPLIVVSPFAKHAYVSHQVHESSGFLRFTEEVFDLPSLGTRDAISDDFADCFDFSQEPRPYTRVPVKVPPEFFLQQTPSGPPDTD